MPVRRERTLARGCEVRPVDLARDMDYIYVGYRKGSLDEMLSDLRRRFDLPEIESLGKAELRAILIDLFALGEFYTLSARTRAFKKADGMVPMALVGATREDHRLWPHVVWFSWASPRNRIECTLRYIEDLRRDNLIYIFDRPEDHMFWVRMAQYGVLRRIGKSEEHWPDGATSVLWRSQGFRRAADAGSG